MNIYPHHQTSPSIIRSLRNAALLGVSTLLVANSAIAAAASYTFTLLESPEHRFTQAYDINNAGQVVGSSAYAAFTPGGFSGSRATLWSGGISTYLNTPVGLGADSSAISINNVGISVGGMHQPVPAAGWPRPVQWNGTTGMELPTVGGSTGVATGINDDGKIVGSYGSHATLWSAGAPHDLGTLGGLSSNAYDINNNGLIVGYSNTPGNTATHATLWDGGTVQDLGSFGNYSYANAINDAGQIVGQSTTWNNAEHHATLWTQGTLVDLGTLGGSDSAASDINAHGQIVGYAYPMSGRSRAFIWENGTMRDLNTFMDSASRSAGWLMESAQAINDNGWVVGQAINEVTHQSRGFLLSVSAVPEPSPVALMLAGLTALGCARHRKLKHRQKLPTADLAS